MSLFSPRKLTFLEWLAKRMLINFKFNPLGSGNVKTEGMLIKTLLLFEQAAVSVAAIVETAVTVEATAAAEEEVVADLEGQPCPLLPRWMTKRISPLWANHPQGNEKNLH